MMHTPMSKGASLFCQQEVLAIHVQTSDNAKAAARSVADGSAGAANGVAEQITIGSNDDNEEEDEDEDEDEDGGGGSSDGQRWRGKRRLRDGRARSDRGNRERSRDMGRVRDGAYRGGKSKGKGNAKGRGKAAHNSRRYLDEEYDSDDARAAASAKMARSKATADSLRAGGHAGAAPFNQEPAMKKLTTKQQGFDFARHQKLRDKLLEKKTHQVTLTPAEREMLAAKQDTQRARPPSLPRPMQQRGGPIAPQHFPRRTMEIKKEDTYDDFVQHLLKPPDPAQARMDRASRAKQRQQRAQEVAYAQTAAHKRKVAQKRKQATKAQRRRQGYSDGNSSEEDDDSDQQGMNDNGDDDYVPREAKKAKKKGAKRRAQPKGRAKWPAAATAKMEDLSEYEIAREYRMAQNKKMMESLGLGSGSKKMMGTSSSSSSSAPSSSGESAGTSSASEDDDGCSSTGAQPAATVCCALTQAQEIAYMKELQTETTFKTLQKLEEMIAAAGTGVGGNVDSDDGSDDAKDAATDAGSGGGSSDSNADNADETAKTMLQRVAVQLRKACNHPLLLADSNSHNGSESASAGSSSAAAIGSPISVQAASLKEILYASGKFLMLDRMLIKFRSANRKVCVFTNCSDTLDLLDRYCYLRGWRYICLGDAAAHPRAHAANVNAFNHAESRHFLLLAGNKTSGNADFGLHTADTIIFFDSNEDHQADRKTVARCNRPGRTAKVLVCRLLVSGSAEESLFRRPPPPALLPSPANAGGAFGYGVVHDATAERIRLKGLVKHLFHTIMYGSDTIAAAAAGAATGAGAGAATASSTDLDALLRKPSRQRGNSNGVTSGGDAMFAGKFERSCAEHKAMLQAPRPTKLHAFSAAKLPDIVERPGFDSEDRCLQCWKAFALDPKQDDRAQRLTCTVCPTSMHASCARRHEFAPGDAGSAEAGGSAAEKWSCPHHRCSVCHKAPSPGDGKGDGAAILYACAACPIAYCNECLPAEVAESKLWLLGTCNRMEDVGFHRPANSCYILCSAACESFIVGNTPVANSDHAKRHACFLPTNVTASPLEDDVDGGTGSGGGKRDTCVETVGAISIAGSDGGAEGVEGAGGAGAGAGVSENAASSAAVKGTREAKSKEGV